MDILIENLYNDNNTQEIKYSDVIIDLHHSKGIKRGRYINYIVHGINKGILDIDKLFYKSVLACACVDDCFAVGVFLRMGAKVDRFYNGKNIGTHIVDRYYNYNEELFVFLMTMMLLKGLTYNDYTDQSSPNTLGDYFKTKSIEIFFPKNIRLESQRLMNLFMDDKLTKDDYSYQPIEIVENLNVNLVHKKLVDKGTKYCEDLLVKDIIDACNFNLLMAAFEASYSITYFSIERICVELRKSYEDNNTILAEQLLEMLHYLEKKKIYIDEYQYTYIRDIDSSFNYQSTKNVNQKIKELLQLNMKENENPMYTLTKLKFLPSYVYELDGVQLENVKYKAIHYRIERNGVEKVMDRI